MKGSTNIIFYSILIFHVAWCSFSFYSTFSDFEIWTKYHWQPIALLVLTLAWVGVCMKKYIFGFVYIGLVMVEFLMKAVFRDSVWADVFDTLMFPVNLIFVAILLFLFKPHFGILQRPNAVSDKSK